MPLAGPPSGVTKPTQGPPGVSRIDGGGHFLSERTKEVYQESFMIASEDADHFEPSVLKIGHSDRFQSLSCTKSDGFAF